MCFLRQSRHSMHRINRYMLGCKLPDASKAPLSGIGINRYMLGCKWRTSSSLIPFKYRINRYMLGCKWSNIIIFVFIIARINRYMLGCKWRITADITRCSFELIDTCWDVNLLSVHTAYLQSLELIDTCWDVNHHKMMPNQQ